ncbi:jerky protein homolog-like isoform X1 [Neodiprion virginianus]|uniref:jerky protein homolog-like isoform X1 n=1 Tax=Neodiprion virginianus TaxID=2961670 RepID=UPI001EE6F3A9|nr:jerky protein homolog-like isoform X1 [Neodiprion virginianus]
METMVEKNRSNVTSDNMTNMCNSKRRKKLASFTAQQKLDILKKIDEGFSITMVALENNVDTSTVRKWRNSRQKIEKCSEISTEAKRIRSGRAEKVNEALYMWFTEMWAKGYPVTGTIIKGKALEFHERFGAEEKFYASDGWLSHWRQKYGIRQLSITSESSSPNSESADNFKSQFTKKIKNENLTASQIFNAEVTGLNYKVMPNEALTNDGERPALGFNQNKEKLTVMLCCNADSSLKIPLLIIRKSSKPKGLKNLLPNMLPVYYTRQKSAWMNSAIFEKWFKEEFVPTVSDFLREKGLPQKAMLLIGNAPSHPSTEVLTVGDITTRFLPPNVTSLIQPMDQGIIENVKRRYRNKLLMHILNDQCDGKELVESLKSINIKNAVFWASEAWDETSSEIIVKCWKNLMLDIPEKELHVTFEAEEEITSERIHQIANRIKSLEKVSLDVIDDWIYNDDSSLVFPSDEDIVEAVNNHNSENESDTDNFEESQVSPLQASRAAECLTKFFQQNGAISKADMAVLRKVKEKILQIKNQI